MKDFIEIGSVPHGEDCEQVGTKRYDPIFARLECNVYRGQLIRTFGIPPGSAHLSIKSNQHDFGNYSEVVCRFDSDDEESVEYAFKCESDGPEFWDEESLILLRDMRPDYQSNA